jgi:hypothetical protein
MELSCAELSEEEGTAMAVTAGDARRPGRRSAGRRSGPTTLPTAQR